MGSSLSKARPDKRRTLCGTQGRAGLGCFSLGRSKARVERGDSGDGSDYSSHGLTDSSSTYVVVTDTDGTTHTVLSSEAANNASRESYSVP